VTSADEAQALDRFLRSQVGADGEVEVHETPAAKVFVGPERVLKIKKPVDFGFLDFTTLGKREWATRRELAFNRETAPDVYRAVHAIVRAPDGGFALDQGLGQEHDRDVIEWALEMRPFRGPVLADHPDRVDGALAERLGRAAARLHGRARVSTTRKGAAVLDYVLTSNAHQLRSLGAVLDQEAVERLIAESRTAFNALGPLLDRRGEGGLVRRCHGDLHLGNIVVEQDRPILFDCIEFNDALSEIDVAYDIAFLLMDLGFRGRPDAANRVLNAWTDEAARTLGDGAWESLALLPLCQSMRAAVRAHVSGHGGARDTARAYGQAALRHLAPSPPRLFAVGGLSGSGKSTLARALAPRLGPAPGAVVLRSDEIRKRLGGVGPRDRLPRDAYGSESSQTVYAEMLRLARQCLDAGWAVVLDAAFLNPAERTAAEGLGAELGLPFQGVWLQAAAELLSRRVRDRVDDASDADVAVLEGQLARDVGDVNWRCVDAASNLDDQVATYFADVLNGSNRSAGPPNSGWPR
jgi:aminoglycoside phosphotransferase family enzyme/predicted kinase